MSIRGSSRGLIFEWNYGLIAVPFKEAGVAKLADAPDLGSGGAILRGSSPLSGTTNRTRPCRRSRPRKFGLRHSIENVDRCPGFCPEGT